MKDDGVSKKDDKSNENKDSDRNLNIGCGVIVFIFLICGIPAATKGEGPIGSIVITIGSIVIAYYISKALANLD